MLAEGSPENRGYARLLARKGFVNIFAAGVASIGGFAVAEVCLVWIVFVTTHSAWNVALYGLSAALPAVAFSVVGGALVDRYDRKRLMIFTDLARSATIAGLVGLLFFGGFQFAAILAANVIISVLSTLFNPAEQTYLPSIVSESELPDANGLVNSSRSAAGFVGSALAGGLIVAVGPLAGLGLDAATLALSTGLIYLLPPAVSVHPSDLERRANGLSGFAQEIREGFLWLWNSKAWFQLTVSAGFFNFFSTLYQTFFVFYSIELLHGDAFVFGSLLAAAVAGQGAGSLLVARVGAVRHAGVAWLVPYGVLSGIMLLILALVPNLAVALSITALLGVAGGFAGTAWLTAAQLMVPREIQGRYFGVDGLGSWVIIPAAQVVGGLLVGLVGVGQTYLFAGVAWTAIGLVFLLPRSLRRLEYRIPSLQPPRQPRPEER